MNQYERSPSPCLLPIRWGEGEPFRAGEQRDTRWRSSVSTSRAGARTTADLRTSPNVQTVSLAPSDGERVGVRGASTGLDPRHPPQSSCSKFRTHAATRRTGGAVPEWRAEWRFERIPSPCLPLGGARVRRRMALVHGLARRSKRSEPDGDHECCRPWYKFFIILMRKNSVGSCAEAWPL